MALYKGTEKVSSMVLVKEFDKPMIGLTVTPSTTTQVFTAPSSASGYRAAVVKAVTSSIDSNVQAGNVCSGVSILGTSGTYNGLVGSVLNAIHDGTYTPTSPSNGFTKLEIGTGEVTITTLGTSDVSNYDKAKVECFQEGVPLEVFGSAISKPETGFAWSLDANDIGNYAMYNAFCYCDGLTSVDLSSLTTVSGNYAMTYAFAECMNLESANFSNLTNITGDYAMSYAFSDCMHLTSIDLSHLTSIATAGMYLAFSSCIYLTSVDLSSLTGLANSNSMYGAFQNCTRLTSVDLSSLYSINIRGMYGAFQNCTSLTSMSFPSLRSIRSKAMSGAFQGCTSLTTLSFPALTSTFGSETDQFNGMLSGVTGCTVHFPSNLQSVIGSWSDATNGFGGTNTIVLFDLPATT